MSAGGNYSELTIAAMLGHAAGSVPSRYVHLDEAVQSGVERVATEIARPLDDDTAKAVPTGNVFSIGARSLLVGGFLSVGLVSICQSAASSWCHTAGKRLKIGGCGRRARHN